MNAQTIAALLVRCQAGDTEAWDTLVDAYWHRLYGYSIRATRNPELSQDLVQETFLRIVQRLDQYSDQGKFEAWLFRILVNLVRDHSRKVTRHPLQSTVSLQRGEVADMTDELPSAGFAPNHPLQIQEDVAMLQAAMDRLSETDRQILMLRHFSDMPFKEIARVMNCPLGTVLARAHRALGKLRGLMEVRYEPT